MAMMSYYGDTEWILTPQMAGRRYLIDDRSGTDFFDFRSWSGQYAYNLTIDLRPGATYTVVNGFGYQLQFATWTIIENIAAGDGHDSIVSNHVANVIFGMAGRDRIWSLQGNDLVYGGNGYDTIYAGDGQDVVYGANHADDLYGQAGNDTLHGGAGSDTIYGGDGNDQLWGEELQDHLVGGAGFDTFVIREVMFNYNGGLQSTPYFTPNYETALNAPDIIYGFDNPGAAAGDMIDLNQIDARTVSYPNAAYNEYFIFGSYQVGGIWLTEEGTNTVIYGNTYDGWMPEFKIVIIDGNVRAGQYTADDFFL